MYLHSKSKLTENKTATKKSPPPNQNQIKIKRFSAFKILVDLILEENYYLRLVFWNHICTYPLKRNMK